MRNNGKIETDAECIVNQQMEITASNIKIEKLQSEIELLEKCVDFYGDRDNWFGGNVSIFRSEYFEIDDQKDSEVFRNGKLIDAVGGKLARETKQKLKEIREKTT